jgi:hypothetical protein
MSGMRLGLPLFLRRAAMPALLALAPLLAAPGAARAQAAGAQAAMAPAEAKAAPTANELARQARQRIAERVWRMEGSAEAAGGAAQLGLSDDPKVIETGRRLYLDGVRANGQPLVGTRLDNSIRMSGADAACVMCHRRSGLGAVEGLYQVAPISGRYLFDQDRRAVLNMNRRGNKSFNPRHDPYDLKSLAEALRTGRHESGRTLEALMPRYALEDGEILALGSYLRHLSNAWSPGVTDRAVRLATVITPDVDPERKRIFLATLNGIVAQKNGNMVRGQRTMSSAAEMAMQTDRHWEMSVWELQGAPATWQAQLERRYAENPVFAVVSGLGAGNWQPVHAFCERQAVPCWFPSVGTSPAAAGSADFYSVYFSGGARLEAEVLASQLGQPVKAPARRGAILQVYGEPALVDSAVATLREHLAEKKIASEAVRFEGDGSALARRLAALQAGDHVVFWLAPAELAKLAGMAPPRATPYFSASLGGGDRLALDTAWRSSARVLYPYQLPEARRRGLTYFREWLRIRNLPLENEVLQSEVYFALSYFNDTMVDMLDNVHRDYLLERAENMLSLREAAKAEDEARELSLPRSAQANRNSQPLRDMPQRAIIPRAAPGAVPAMPVAMPRGAGMMALSPEAQADHSGGQTGVSAQSGAPEGTTVYPRLSLAQFQRHASRGAYIMRFDGDALRAESDWIIP